MLSLEKFWVKNMFGRKFGKLIEKSGFDQNIGYVLENNI